MSGCTANSLGKRASLEPGHTRPVLVGVEGVDTEVRCRTGVAGGSGEEGGGVAGRTGGGTRERCGGRRAAASQKRGGSWARERLQANTANDFLQLRHAEMGGQEIQLLSGETFRVVAGSHDIGDLRGRCEPEHLTGCGIHLTKDWGKIERRRRAEARANREELMSMIFSRTDTACGDLTEKLAGTGCSRPWLQPILATAALATWRYTVNCVLAPKANKLPSVRRWVAAVAVG
ncbi:hypothetical protein B0H13DRAFT_1877512 [Mycena leptocephala]|nr:hypothetical protein B0H13DRAFT_1877512 [Mycena leptocephala]